MHNLRKAAYIAQKPYNLRTHTDTAVLDTSTRKEEEKDFKRHGVQQEGQVHTSQLLLEKARKLNAPIILEDLMVKEIPLTLEDGDIRELSVLTDPTNEDSTHIKRKIRILDHPKNLIEVLRTRLSIAQGLTGNNIPTGSNQYRFTRTFLDGEALRIFDLKWTELCHETVANLIVVLNNFSPILFQKSVAPSRIAMSITKWKNHAISPQDSMWD